MRRRHWVVGSGIAVLAAAAAIGSATASGGAPSARWGAAFAGAPGASTAADDGAATAAMSGRTVIELYDQATDENAFIDVGPPDFSPGDYVVFHDHLLTADNSQQ